jgi:hypothetical protein
MVEELRLPPPDRGGPFGMSIPQVLAIVVSVAAVILIMRSGNYQYAALYSAVAVLLMMRIGGVHGYQWFRTLVRVARIFFKGGISYRSRAQAEGFTLDRPEIMDDVRKIVGGRIQVSEFPYRDGGLAVTHNRDTGLAGVAFKSRGTGFLSQDSGDQLSFLDRFAGLLDKLAEGQHPVAEYKWIHRTTPATTAQTEHFNDTAVDPVCRPGEEEARFNLALAQFSNVDGATCHDIEQVIGLSPKVGSVFRRNHRLAGGGLANLVTQMLPHVNTLSDDLVALGVKEVQPLGRAALYNQLERAFGGEIKEIDKAQLELELETEPGKPVELTGGIPLYQMYLPPHQRWVIINGRYAQSMYVTGYSKKPVSPHHLASQLNVHGVCRAVAVVARPHKSGLIQQVSDEITASVGEGLSDRRAKQEIRERVKYMTRANWLRRREHELDDGRSDWLWASYVTVWADSLEELAASVELVRKQAKDSKLPRLRNMWGWQLEGAMYTSPVCVG